jgi:gentisate 1,2-dioxygenase
MNHTLTPADVSHCHQRLAELSMLPFQQLPDITEPPGPEHGHVRHWRDIYPELARSREILDDALQRSALCLRNPWQEAYPALQRLMARAAQHSPVTMLEYHNPVTGGPALTILACLLEGMPAGARRMTDRPIQDAFGLYRAEATDAIPSPADPEFLATGR